MQGLGRRTARVIQSTMLGSAVVAAYLPADVALGLDFPSVWLARGVTVLAFWALAARLVWRGEGAVESSRTLLAVVGMAGTVAIVAASGGITGPYGHFLYLVPLLVAVLSSGQLRAAVVAQAVAAVGGLALGLSSGQPGAVLAIWAASQAFSALISLAGVKLARRIREVNWQRREEELALHRSHLAVERERERAEAAERFNALERRSSHLERLAILGRVTAGVGHELNNPLAFARANLTFLQEELAGHPDPEVRDALAATSMSVTQIQGIIKDLKGFSRAEADFKHRTHVASAVGDAVRIAGFRAKGVARLDVSQDDEGLEVTMSRQRLTQILVNLIVNAVDALESQRRSAPGTVEVTVRRSEGLVQLAVRDDGPGIPPDVQARLWDGFVTTKAEGKGLGLGLPLTRQYVEQAGGRIVVDSVAGEGTRFTVELPACVVPRVSSSSSAQRRAPGMRPAALH